MEWLDAVWERLNRTRLQGRLPHALLVLGAEGTGKQVLAMRLASALLCENPRNDGQVCGQCPACGWLRAGTHPDLMPLAPVESGKAIRVDQIRALCSELGMTSHAGRYKVAIIQPADAMNANAANSLLKTLEEPTANTLLLLLTASPGKLPATIRSRCQQIRLAAPPVGAARRWLEAQGLSAETARRCIQMAGGAPLKALELAQSDLAELRAQRLAELSQVLTGQLDAIELAGTWMDEHEPEALRWWLEWLRQLVAWRHAGRTPVDGKAVHKLQKILEAVDSRQMYQIADGITQALNSVGSGLNRQLILEDLLIRWAKMPGSNYQRGGTGNG
ncbi:MAG: DNA polymerase III subunit delta' [Gammaproteobacteria bacterium]|jgi:DNA polymerase-3 subunit delta'